MVDVDEADEAEEMGATGRLLGSAMAKKRGHRG
jgi:hypothetical protein